ncbi:Inner membrane protein YdcO [Ureibacillus acetophenoni]
MKVFRMFNYNVISTGIVAALLVYLAPTAFILKAGEHFQLSTEQLTHWVLAVYMFAGIFGIIIPLVLKKPVVGGHSLAGMAFLTTVSVGYTFNELIGAFIFSSIFIIIVGLFGLFTKIMKVIPKEIISAMLAGIITKYMIDFFIAIEKMLAIGLISTVVFFAILKYRSSLNPILLSISVAFVLFFGLNPIGQLETSISSPISIYLPSFDFLTMFSISIPLALMILSNDIAIGLSGLKQNDYEVNQNRLVTLSGVFSLFTNFFGGQSTNVAGMTTTLCAGSEAGERGERYLAAVTSGVIVLCLGLLSFLLMEIIVLLPSEFISFIVGLSLLNVYIHNIKLTFYQNSNPLCATFTFLIALSGINMLGISSPIIALMVGTLLTKFLKEKSRVEVNDNQSLVDGMKKTTIEIPSK